jgi:hypothetical protein
MQYQYTSIIINHFKQLQEASRCRQEVGKGGRRHLTVLEKAKPPQDVCGGFMKP